VCGSFVPQVIFSQAAHVHVAPPIHGAAIGARADSPVRSSIPIIEEHRPSAEPTLYAVEGKVLVNGEPAENLNVAFHPIDGDKNRFCPVGRTNNKGIFHLMTRSGADGAPAGKYSVTLVWPDV